MADTNPWKKIAAWVGYSLDGNINDPRLLLNDNHAALSPHPGFSTFRQYVQDFTAIPGDPKYNAGVARVQFVYAVEKAFGAFHNTLSEYNEQMAENTNISNLIKGMYLRQVGELAITNIIYVETKDRWHSLEYYGNSSESANTICTHTLFGDDNTLFLKLLSSEEKNKCCNNNNNKWEIVAPNVFGENSIKFVQSGTDTDITSSFTAVATKKVKTPFIYVDTAGVVGYCPDEEGFNQVFLFDDTSAPIGISETFVVPTFFKTEESWNAPVTVPSKFKSLVISKPLSELPLPLFKTVIGTGVSALALAGGIVELAHIIQLHADYWWFMAYHSDHSKNLSDDSRVKQNLLRNKGDAKNFWLCAARPHMFDAVEFTQQEESIRRYSDINQFEKEKPSANLKWLCENFVFSNGMNYGLVENDYRTLATSDATIDITELQKMALRSNKYAQNSVQVPYPFTSDIDGDEIVISEPMKCKWSSNPAVGMCPFKRFAYFVCNFDQQMVVAQVGSASGLVVNVFRQSFDELAEEDEIDKSMSPFAWVDETFAKDGNENNISVEEVHLSSNGTKLFALCKGTNLYNMICLDMSTKKWTRQRFDDLDIDNMKMTVNPNNDSCMYTYNKGPKFYSFDSSTSANVPALDNCSPIGMSSTEWFVCKETSSKFTVQSFNPSTDAVEKFAFSQAYNEVPFTHAVRANNDAVVAIQNGIAKLEEVELNLNNIAQATEIGISKIYIHYTFESEKVTLTKESGARDRYVGRYNDAPIVLERQTHYSHFGPDDLSSTVKDKMISKDNIWDTLDSGYEGIPVPKGEDSDPEYAGTNDVCKYWYNNGRPKDNPWKLTFVPMKKDDTAPEMISGGYGWNSYFRSDATATRDWFSKAKDYYKIYFLRTNSIANPVPDGKKAETDFYELKRLNNLDDPNPKVKKGDEFTFYNLPHKLLFGTATYGYNDFRGCGYPNVNSTSLWKWFAFTGIGNFLVTDEVSEHNIMPIFTGHRDENTFSPVFSKTVKQIHVHTDNGSKMVDVTMDPKHGLCLIDPDEVNILRYGGRSYGLNNLDHLGGIEFTVSGYSTLLPVGAYGLFCKDADDYVKYVRKYNRVPSWDFDDVAMKNEARILLKHNCLEDHADINCEKWTAATGSVKKDVTSVPRDLDPLPDDVPNGGSLSPRLINSMINSLRAISDFTVNADKIEYNDILVLHGFNLQHLNTEPVLKFVQSRHIRYTESVFDNHKSKYAYIPQHYPAKSDHDATPRDLACIRTHPMLKNVDVDLFPWVKQNRYGKGSPKDIAIEVRYKPGEEQVNLLTYPLPERTFVMRVEINETDEQISVSDFVTVAWKKVNSGTLKKFELCGNVTDIQGNYSEESFEDIKITQKDGTSKAELTNEIVISDSLSIKMNFGELTVKWPKNDGSEDTDSLKVFVPADVPQNPLTITKFAISLNTVVYCTKFTDETQKKNADYYIGACLADDTADQTYLSVVFSREKYKGDAKNTTSNDSFKDDGQEFNLDHSLQVPIYFDNVDHLTCAAINADFNSSSANFKSSIVCIYFESNGTVYESIAGTMEIQYVSGLTKSTNHFYEDEPSYSFAENCPIGKTTINALKTPKCFRAITIPEFGESDITHVESYPVSESSSVWVCICQGGTAVVYKREFSFEEQEETDPNDISDSSAYCTFVRRAGGVTATGNPNPKVILTHVFCSSTAIYFPGKGNVTIAKFSKSNPNKIYCWDGKALCMQMWDLETNTCDAMPQINGNPVLFTADVSDMATRLYAGKQYPWENPKLKNLLNTDPQATVYVTPDNEDDTDVPIVIQLVLDIKTCEVDYFQNYPIGGTNAAIPLTDFGNNRSSWCDESTSYTLNRTQVDDYGEKNYLVLYDSDNKRLATYTVVSIDCSYDVFSGGKVHVAHETIGTKPEMGTSRAVITPYTAVEFTNNDVNYIGIPRTNTRALPYYECARLSIGLAKHLFTEEAYTNLLRALKEYATFECTDEFVCVETTDLNFNYKALKFKDRNSAFGAETIAPNVVFKYTAGHGGKLVFPKTKEAEPNTPLRMFVTATVLKESAIDARTFANTVYNGMAGSFYPDSKVLSGGKRAYLRPNHKSADNETMLKRCGLDLENVNRHKIVFLPKLASSTCYRVKREENDSQWIGFYEELMRAPRENALIRPYTITLSGVSTPTTMHAQGYYTPTVRYESILNNVFSAIRSVLRNKEPPKSEDELFAIEHSESSTIGTLLGRALVNQSLYEAISNDYGKTMPFFGGFFFLFFFFF